MLPREERIVFTSLRHVIQILHLGRFVRDVGMASGTIGQQSNRLELLCKYDLQTRAVLLRWHSLQGTPF